MKMCDCFGKSEKALEERHLEYVGAEVGFGFDAHMKMTTCIVIRVKKMKGAPRGTKPVHLICTFCPICGKRLRAKRK